MCRYDAVMQLQEILFSQGFGTRRICAGLIQQGHVRIEHAQAWQVCEDPLLEVEASEGWRYEVLGQVWPYHARAYVLLHKPAGYECSHKPSAWPSI